MNETPAAARAFPRASGAERPLPATLRRNAPLVPVDSAGGRALAGGDRDPDLPRRALRRRRRARRGEFGAMALRRRAGDHDPGAPERAARHRGGRGARRRPRPPHAGHRAGASLLQGAIRAPARALARHRARLRRPAGAAPHRRSSSQAGARPDLAPLRQALRERGARRDARRPRALGSRGCRPWPNTIIGVGVGARRPGPVAAGLAVDLRDPGRHGGEPGGRRGAAFRRRQRRLHRPRVPAPVLPARARGSAVGAERRSRS